MTKEMEEKACEAAALLESLTNDYACRENLKSVVERMATMHRTLVQSFVGGFVMPFVRKMAKMHRQKDYDDRDKAAAEVCDEMSKAIEKLYDIGEDDEIRLPCI